MNLTDMTEVDRDTFYATVGQLDVHPRCSDREYDVWELRDRTVVGYTTPGYRGHHPNEADRYYVLNRLAPHHREGRRT